MPKCWNGLGNARQERVSNPSAELKANGAVAAPFDNVVKVCGREMWPSARPTTNWHIFPKNFASFSIGGSYLLLPVLFAPGAIGAGPDVHRIGAAETVVVR